MRSSRGHCLPILTSVPLCLPSGLTEEKPNGLGRSPSFGLQSPPGGKEKASALSSSGEGVQERHFAVFLAGMDDVSQTGR
jgi:hypothetical protein